MNDTTSTPPEVVATFRYSVIAPLVVRPLMFGEQRALVAEQAEKIWQWPDGVHRPVHARTLLRWVAAYRTPPVAVKTPHVWAGRLRPPAQTYSPSACGLSTASSRKL